MARGTVYVQERDEKQQGALKEGGWGEIRLGAAEEEVVVKLRRGTSWVFVLKMRSVPFTMQVFLPAIRRGLSLFLSCTVLLDLFLLLG
jgi:hypothetical protein